MEISFKLKWIDVNKDLPDYDDYVLWVYENGRIIHEYIDKDWDDRFFRIFIEGNRYSGKIIAWCKAPNPPIF